VPIEVRIPSESNQDPGSLENIRVKISILGSHDTLESVRIELQSEANLFFSYIHNVDERGDDYR
jgi:hypothetical protein